MLLRKRWGCKKSSKIENVLFILTSDGLILRYIYFNKYFYVP